MGSSTKIQWTDFTFNHVIGCTKVAAGCTNCYAEADMDRRRGRVKWGPHGTRSRTSEAYWRAPLKWDREAKAAGERRRVFCASLSDVFEAWDGPIVDHLGRELRLVNGEYRIPDHPEWPWPSATMDDLRCDLFRLIDATPNLDWLLLTKRPENIRRMWPRDAVEFNVLDAAAGRESFHPRLNHRENVWLLTSVAVQADADKNIPHLLACRDLAPVLGVSAEPLLGPVDLTNVQFDRHVRMDVLEGSGLSSRSPCQSIPNVHGPRLDWVIVGGESGPNARPCDLAWVRSLVAQCKAAGVACFVKQLGAVVRTELRDENNPAYRGYMDSTYRDRKGGDPEEWSTDLRVREFPRC